MNKSLLKENPSSKNVLNESLDEILSYVTSPDFCRTPWNCVTISMGKVRPGKRRGIVHVNRASLEKENNFLIKFHRCKKKVCDHNICQKPCRPHLDSSVQIEKKAQRNNKCKHRKSSTSILELNREWTVSFADFMKQSSGFQRKTPDPLINDNKKRGNKKKNRNRSHAPRKTPSCVLYVYANGCKRKVSFQLHPEMEEFMSRAVDKIEEYVGPPRRPCKKFSHKTMEFVEDVGEDTVQISKDTKRLSKKSEGKKKGSKIPKPFASSESFVKSPKKSSKISGLQPEISDELFFSQKSYVELHEPTHREQRRQKTKKKVSPAFESESESSDEDTNIVTKHPIKSIKTGGISKRSSTSLKEDLKSLPSTRKRSSKQTKSPEDEERIRKSKKSVSGSHIKKYDKDTSSDSSMEDISDKLGQSLKKSRKSKDSKIREKHSKQVRKKSSDSSLSDEESFTTIRESTSAKYDTGPIITTKIPGTSDLKDYKHGSSKLSFKEPRESIISGKSKLSSKDSRKSTVFKKKPSRHTSFRADKKGTSLEHPGTKRPSSKQGKKSLSIKKSSIHSASEESGSQLDTPPTTPARGTKKSKSLETFRGQSKKLGSSSLHIKSAVNSDSEEEVSGVDSPELPERESKKPEDSDKPIKRSRESTKIPSLKMKSSIHFSPDEEASDDSSTPESSKSYSKKSKPSIKTMKLSRESTKGTPVERKSTAFIGSEEGVSVEYISPKSPKKDSQKSRQSTRSRSPSEQSENRLVFKRKSTEGERQSRLSTRSYSKKSKPSIKSMKSSKKSTTRGPVERKSTTFIGSEGGVSVEYISPKSSKKDSKKSRQSTRSRSPSEQSENRLVFKRKSTEGDSPSRLYSKKSKPSIESMKSYQESITRAPVERKSTAIISSGGGVSVEYISPKSSKRDSQKSRQSARSMRSSEQSDNRLVFKRDPTEGDSQSRLLSRSSKKPRHSDRSVKSSRNLSPKSSLRKGSTIYSGSKVLPESIIRDSEKSYFSDRLVDESKKTSSIKLESDTPPYSDEDRAESIKVSTKEEQSEKNISSFKKSVKDSIRSRSTDSDNDISQFESLPKSLQDSVRLGRSTRSTDLKESSLPRKSTDHYSFKSDEFDHIDSPKPSLKKSKLSDKTNKSSLKLEKIPTAVGKSTIHSEFEDSSQEETAPKMSSRQDSKKSKDSEEIMKTSIESDRRSSLKHKSTIQPVLGRVGDSANAISMKSEIREQSLEHVPSTRESHIERKSTILGPNGEEYTRRSTEYTKISEISKVPPKELDRESSIKRKSIKQSEREQNIEVPQEESIYEPKYSKQTVRASEELDKKSSLSAKSTKLSGSEDDIKPRKSTKKYSSVSEAAKKTFHELEGDTPEPQESFKKSVLSKSIEDKEFSPQYSFRDSKEISELERTSSQLNKTKTQSELKDATNEISDAKESKNDVVEFRKTSIKKSIKSERFSKLKDSARSSKPERKSSEISISDSSKTAEDSELPEIEKKVSDTSEKSGEISKTINQSIRVSSIKRSTRRETENSSEREYEASKSVKTIERDSKLQGTQIKDTSIRYSSKKESNLISSVLTGGRQSKKESRISKDSVKTSKLQSILDIDSEASIASEIQSDNSQHSVRLSTKTRDLKESLASQQLSERDSRKTSRVTEKSQRKVRTSSEDELQKHGQLLEDKKLSGRTSKQEIISKKTSYDKPSLKQSETERRKQPSSRKTRTSTQDVEDPKQGLPMHICKCLCRKVRSSAKRGEEIASNSSSISSGSSDKIKFSRHSSKKIPSTRRISHKCTCKFEDTQKIKRNTKNRIQTDKYLKNTSKRAIKTKDVSLSPINFSDENGSTDARKTSVSSIKSKNDTEETYISGKKSFPPIATSTPHKTSYQRRSVKESLAPKSDTKINSSVVIEPRRKTTYTETEDDFEQIPLNRDPEMSLHSKKYSSALQESVAGSSTPQRSLYSEEQSLINSFNSEKETNKTKNKSSLARENSTKELPPRQHQTGTPNTSLEHKVIHDKSVHKGRTTPRELTFPGQRSVIQYYPCCCCRCEKLEPTTILIDRPDRPKGRSQRSATNPEHIQTVQDRHTHSRFSHPRPPYDHRNFEDTDISELSTENENYAQLSNHSRNSYRVDDDTGYNTINRKSVNGPLKRKRIGTSDSTHSGIYEQSTQSQSSRVRGDSENPDIIVTENISFYNPRGGYQLVNNKRLSAMDNLNQSQNYDYNIPLYSPGISRSSFEEEILNDSRTSVMKKQLGRESNPNKLRGIIKNREYHVPDSNFTFPGQDSSQEGSFRINRGHMVNQRTGTEDFSKGNSSVTIQSIELEDMSLNPIPRPENLVSIDDEIMLSRIEPITSELYERYLNSENNQQFQNNQLNVNNRNTNQIFSDGNNFPPPVFSSSQCADGCVPFDYRGLTTMHERISRTCKCSMQCRSPPTPEEYYYEQQNTDSGTIYNKDPFRNDRTINYFQVESNYPNLINLKFDPKKYHDKFLMNPPTCKNEMKNTRNDTFDGNMSVTPQRYVNVNRRQLDGHGDQSQVRQLKVYPNMNTTMNYKNFSAGVHDINNTRKTDFKSFQNKGKNIERINEHTFDKTKLGNNTSRYNINKDALKSDGTRYSCLNATINSREHFLTTDPIAKSDTHREILMEIHNLMLSSDKTPFLRKLVDTHHSSCEALENREIINAEAPRDNQKTEGNHEPRLQNSLRTKYSHTSNSSSCESNHSHSTKIPTLLKEEVFENGNSEPNLIKSEIQYAAGKGGIEFDFIDNIIQSSTPICPQPSIKPFNFHIEVTNKYSKISEVCDRNDDTHAFQHAKSKTKLTSGAVIVGQKNMKSFSNISSLSDGQMFVRRISVNKNHHKSLSCTKIDYNSIYNEDKLNNQPNSGTTNSSEKQGNNSYYNTRTKSKQLSANNDNKSTLNNEISTEDLFNKEKIRSQGTTKTFKTLALCTGKSSSDEKGENLVKDDFHENTLIYNEGNGSELLNETYGGEERKTNLNCFGSNNAKWKKIKLSHFLQHGEGTLKKEILPSSSSIFCSLNSMDETECTSNSKYSHFKNNILIKKPIRDRKCQKQWKLASLQSKNSMLLLKSHSESVHHKICLSKSSHDSMVQEETYYFSENSKLPSENKVPTFDNEDESRDDCIGINQLDSINKSHPYLTFNQSMQRAKYPFQNPLTDPKTGFDPH